MSGTFWLGYVVGSILTPVLVVVAHGVFTGIQGARRGFGTQWGYECPACDGLQYSHAWPWFVPRRIAAPIARRQARRAHWAYYASDEAREEMPALYEKHLAPQQDGAA